MKTFDCVDGNMNILMYNNTVKKIKDVKKGDTVYSVRYNGDKYQYFKSEVVAANKRRSNAVKITLNDGRILICSPTHQWLTKMGWMFTFDDDSLGIGKFFLKEDIKMSGITGEISDKYTESKLYMQGYFVGSHINCKNLVGFKGGETASLVLQESDVTSRLYNYLIYLGADATIEYCFAHDNDTNEYYVTPKLSIPYSQLISMAERFSKNRDKEDFLRGFVAGAYDAEGSENPLVKRVRSCKRDFLELMKKGLKLYNFEYIYDSQEMTASLVGGPSELLRFYNIFIPVTISRIENYEITYTNPDSLKVVSVEETKCDDMIEIITTGRNFIANGVISHNCTTGLVKEV